MTIRAYTDADRNGVLNLLRLNTPAYFSASEEQDLVYYLDNHLENYFVVEEDNVLLACGGFNLSDTPDTIKISWDIVAPESQGKGVGTALTKFRIEQIKSMAGVKVIVVRTSQFVFKFYEKLGFELKQIVKDYWAEGFDLYFMELALLNDNIAVNDKV